MAMRHQNLQETPHTHTDDIQREEATVREPFGVAQVIAFVVGMASVVVGAIGLIRTGTTDLTGEATVVAGLTMTGALALGHLVLGLLALLGAAGRGAAISSLAVTGPVLIAAGIIAIVQQVEWLAWTQTNGIVYLVAGVIALAGAAMTRDTAIVEHRTIRVG